MGTRSRHIPSARPCADSLTPAAALGLVLALCGLCDSALAQESALSQEPLVHEIALPDPLHPDRPARDYAVTQTFDARGFPVEYRLLLQTEICPDEEECNLLEVTLVWDALGKYSHLERTEDKPLTKLEHDPFTAEDYGRLDTILKDRRSMLGERPLRDFVMERARIRPDIDGISAATPPSTKDAVVKGAAYTSWVLWRWVHGEVVDELVIRTLPYCEGDYRLHCLTSDDPDFVAFALRHLLLEEGIADPELRGACFHALEHSNRANGALALDILATSPPETAEFHRQLIARIGGNPDASRLVLVYFQELAGADPKVWEQLAARLAHVSDPGEFDIAVDLLEERAGDSKAVQARIAALRKSQNRRIARRAKEFLERQ